MYNLSIIFIRNQNNIMPKQPRDHLCVALDNISDKTQLSALVNEIKEYVGVYKIGLEQFVRFGPPILDIIREVNGKIFLDLKLHDIPNTVAKAVTAACSHTIDYLTIHTSGGKAMLEAAAEAAEKAPNPPKLLGVTVLTSIDEKTLRHDLGVERNLPEQVVHLTKLAVDANMDGIVCSAVDLPHVTPHTPEHFELVTPGIRLPDEGAGDQKRVATPDEAVKAGATLLVVGRGLVQAQNKHRFLKRIFAILYNK
ncbi:MAG: orotidine-5'-phosphate decarboxylase [Chitinivibrionales bacterium]|nr:orotidine-5'-phosphate decarboxylase [Chitinivibrionales bacterium]